MQPLTDEQAFRDWYAEWAARAGLNPNPDDPQHHYDYRRAYGAGVVPQVDPADQRYHWPSQFKLETHPNRIVNGIDTITGQPVQPPHQALGLAHLGPGGGTLDRWRDMMLRLEAGVPSVTEDQVAIPRVGPVGDVPMFRMPVAPPGVSQVPWWGVQL